MDLKEGDLVSYREYPDFMDTEVWNDGIGIIINPHAGDGIVEVLAGDRVISVFSEDVELV